MLRHILIKLTKIKDKQKILKATRKKQQIRYKGISKMLSAILSRETLQAITEEHDIFKVMKGINPQARLLYPARLSFRFDQEIKSLTNKQKLKRIQCHQTSFTTNPEGTSLGGKEKATT